MKEPKILLSRIGVIFHVICVLLALYMAMKNIGRFHEDKSATVITYKRYGHTVEDIYPSFSVCLEGYGIYRFNESAIFTAYGIHLSDYEMMLEGRQAFQYGYDPSIQRYRKRSLSPTFEPSIDLKTQALFQLPRIIEKTSFVATNESQSIFFGKKDEISVERLLDEPPLYASYQSSKLFCLTRKQSYTSDFIRHHDAVLLDLSSVDSNTKLEIFIHHPGQLLRSFDTPRLATVLTKVQGNAVNFRVSQTTLLRKRSVQNNPCNKNIDDHDRFLLESLVNDTGCVPPYWRNIIDTYPSLSECSSPEQLKKIYSLIKDYSKILEDREAPCLNMFSSAVWNEEGRDDLEICEKCIYLKIVYLDRSYEEITEIKGFGFEDFISGLGGFLGIFLGCSMMQIPQLLGKSVFY